MLSPVSIVGIHACTLGVSNAPKIDNITSNTLITVRAFLSDKKSAAHRTDNPDNASNATIIFLLFARSERIPPNGDSKIVGIVAIDNIPANIVAEPVTSNTYMDKASFKIKLPNKEVTCPKTRSVKFFVNSFSVIVNSSLLLKYL